MHNLNTTEVTQWYNECQYHLCYQDNKLVSSDGSDQILPTSLQDVKIIFSIEGIETSQDALRFKTFSRSEGLHTEKYGRY